MNPPQVYMFYSTVCELFWYHLFLPELSQCSLPKWSILWWLKSTLCLVWTCTYTRVTWSFLSPLWEPLRPLLRPPGSHQPAQWCSRRLPATVTPGEGCDSALQLHLQFAVLQKVLVFSVSLVWGQHWCYESLTLEEWDVSYFFSNNTSASSASFPCASLPGQGAKALLTRWLLAQLPVLQSHEVSSGNREWIAKLPA